MGLLDSQASKTTPATVENMLDLLASVFLGSVGLYTRFSTEDGLVCYYPPMGYSGANISAAPTASTLTAQPFWSGAGGVVSEIGFSVAVVGAAGSLSRVGIYDADPITQKPRNLIVDGGQIDTNASTGFKSTSGLAITLDPHKLYYLAMNVNANPPTVSGVQNGISVFGLGVPLGDQRGLSVAQAFGALPKVFTPGATLVAGTNFPLIVVRFSSYNRQ